MDLLQDNKKKKNKTPAQKIVVSLLIISIILCIIIGITMFFVSMQEKDTTFSITINGKNVDLNKFKLISNNNGDKYVSLRSLSENLNYNYYNGEFRKTDEGKNIGHINNAKNIVQFFADSKEIYKTTEESNTDYEYYNLENPILEYEGNIYIAIDDVDVALNLILNYSEDKNKVTIETPENWVLKKEEAFKGQNIVISNTPDNLRALSYGYLIINKDNRYGVINIKTGNEIIGNKYSSITFCEYTGDFIVSNTSNKFGVITKTGVAEVDLQYDSFEILNYNPLLYKVERLEKFGVVRENGSIIGEIMYDSIGYPENKAEELKYTLIVPNLNENIPESIVVCNEDKYGLIDLETGRTIVSCILNGIYTKTEDEMIYYAEMQNEKVYSLETFVENLNRLTVTID